MKKTYILLLLFAFFLLPVLQSFAQQNTEEQLADQYFQTGEYEKAVSIYEKLFDKRPDPFIYKAYTKCLMALKDYNTAEKIIKKLTKKYPDNLLLYVDLGNVYLSEGQQEKARNQYEKAIKQLGTDQQQVIALANAFISVREYNYAIETYLRGRKFFERDYPFFFELAEVYWQKSDLERMINEYMDALTYNEGFIQSVQNTLQTKLSGSADSLGNELLKTALLRKIQKYPDKTIFSELLIWQLIQKKSFEFAFIQVKALDKRLNEDGNRIMSLAELSLSNENYDVAAKCYQYVIEKGRTTRNYVRARMELLNVLNLKITRTTHYTHEDLLRLEQDYKQTLNEFGKNTVSISLIRGLARLEAFYLNKMNDARKLLEEAIVLPDISPQMQAGCKLELGDILLLEGEIWEATLLYSQVDKAFKDDVLGQEAKFRNAKLSYYRGDFAWAKAQLDVLKSATSDLIANDALDLSLLISDNIGYDSIMAPLLTYARADLLIFRKQDSIALQTLDSILTEYSYHSLFDEVLYKKADIMKKKGKYEEAIVFLQQVIDEYPQDVLADDALFMLAGIYEYQLKDLKKAMQLYEIMLLKYPGSLYAVEARKRFRTLRGDAIN